MTTAAFRLHVELPADPSAARERRALLGRAVAALEELLRGVSAEEASTFADQFVRALRPPAPASLPPAATAMTAKATRSAARLWIAPARPPSRKPAVVA